MHMHINNHNIDVCMHAFVAYVTPILENCSYVWNLNLCLDIDLLSDVYRSFTKGIFWKSSVPHLDYLNKLNVAHRQSLERSHLLLI